MPDRTQLAPLESVVVAEVAPEGDPEGSLEGLVVDQRYAVESEVGRGAMGIVYRARHVDLGRAVAIKVLHRRLLRTPTMVERFEREAQLASRLHHPNVVPVLDIGELADGRRTMVLELATGDELGNLLTGPWPQTRAIAILKDLCEGLEHAHRLGLVHRDLKPENIIIEQGEDGTEIPRIIDFGLAILNDDSSMARLTETGRVVGTPVYMAPEQATGGRIDHRADLYSLGVIAFEMFSGARPFFGTNAEVAYAHVAMPPPTIASRLGRPVDPLIEAVVAKLLEKSPGNRFARAHVLRQMLDLIERDRTRAAALLGVTGSVEVEAVDVIDSVDAVPAFVTPVATTPIVPSAWAAMDSTVTASIAPVVHQPPKRIGRWLWVLGFCAVIVELVLFFLIPGEPTREVRAARGHVAELTAPDNKSIEKTAEAPPPIEPIAPAPIVAEPPPMPEPPRAIKQHQRPAVATLPPVVIAPAQERTVELEPELAPPPPVESMPITVSAELLVARYGEVGRMVRAAVAADPLGADPQQIRYRAISIQVALVTPESRRSTFAALDRIARDLAPR